MMRIHLKTLKAIALTTFCLSVSSSAHETKPSKAKASSSASTFGKTLKVDLPSAEDLRVRDLDKVYPVYATFEGQMFAGSLPIDHEQPPPPPLYSDNDDDDDDEPPRARTGNLQFWLFVPDHPTAPNTMVSWFNGGPGCSSMATGLMFEHGPVTVPLHDAGWCCEDAHEPLSPNPFGWTNATVMLYVEQPIGVGFSEATNGTPPPASEDDVAADFESFLQNLYRVFGDLSSHSLHLVGESYAGIYIPSIARGIYLRNEEQQQQQGVSSDRVHIPLGGVAIGNGKMDAITQDPAVIDFSYWHGLIDGPTRQVLHSQWESCMTKVHLENGEIGKAPFGTIKKKESSAKDDIIDKPFHPFNIRDDCGVFAALLEAAGEGSFSPLPGGPNIYEYSTWDPYAAGEGDTGTVGSFYNNIHVQKALNVPAHQLGMHWQGCIPESDSMDERRLSRRNSLESRDTKNMDHPQRRLFMDSDTPWSVVPYVAQLLDEAKIKVLIYSGDRDIICCTQGTEETLRKMDWSGTQEPAPGHTKVNRDQNAWSHATRSLWVYNNTYPAGYIKSYKNLQMLTIYNAGHMVPYNQPGPALDMVERFLLGESFHDRPLVDFVSHAKKNVVEREEESIESRRESSMNGETQARGVSGSLPPTATLLLTVFAAFLMGFVVARLSKGTSSMQSEIMNTGRQGYGSISS